MIQDADIKGIGAKVRNVSVTPPVLRTMAQVTRLMDKIDRNDRINVVNFLTVHYKLNEPPAPPTGA